MTNEQRYETPDERTRAFWRFCKGQEKKRGCLGCPTKCVPIYREKCALAWLALEAEEEKLWPCPLCGHEASIITDNNKGSFIVGCDSCGCQLTRFSREYAIEAWNRRMK